MRIRSIAVAAACVLCLSGCGAPAPKPPAPPPAPAPAPNPPPAPSTSSEDFTGGVTYAAPSAPIDPAVAADFSIDEIANLHDMEKAYGFTFSPAEKAFLAKNKFVEKNLLDTSIRPEAGGYMDEQVREFVQLYAATRGPTDYKARTQANSMFFSSDVFLRSYNDLYTELLKEMENTVFYPSVKALTAKAFQDASAKLAAATDEADRTKWRKVRNYFAVPYAIFSDVGPTLADKDFYGADGSMRDPATVKSEHDAADAKIDTYANAESFVKDLRLDAESEKAVLADLSSIYDPKMPGTPQVFASEYDAYARDAGIDFRVDFTQFTPRSHYTSSSLRREYFRGMKWFIQVPFFLKSPELTQYAFAAVQLMAEDPATLKDYDRLESAIAFLVGTSDDLTPVDYLASLRAAKGAPDATTAAMEYLVKAHDPRIKDLAATYPSVGTVQSADALLKTKGMRFFSGKFIVDSYWTGYLTQGDEAPRPGFDQKLPPMASSLEVMGLLGSDYAKSQIPKLDFYGPKNSRAIDKAMGQLADETAKLDDAFWTGSMYHGWLWTVRALFTWQKDHHDELPAFMRSQPWDAKTLMTASAAWTEARHASLLYAKQSFAELGAGFEDVCDPRDVPPPPKAYIEPQAEAFARLEYLAKRTDEGLKAQGFQLTNQGALESFIGLMGTVRDYVGRELADAALVEKTASSTRPDPQDDKKTCVEHAIDGDSDWEALRLKIVDGLTASIPRPIEGPIVPAKDRRDALVADVHTGGDSENPTRILYEGVGVPNVIFTAVKDANGARLTVGFVSSHYEFTTPLGGPRLTDEDWQKGFYKGTDPAAAYDYEPKKGWPAENFWYAPLIPAK